MIWTTMQETRRGIEGTIEVGATEVTVVDEHAVRARVIDDLIWTAVFSPDAEVRAVAIWLIRTTAAALGAIPSSIQGLYEAMARGEVGGFTVPAMNIRGMTYDVCRAAFRAAKAKDVGALIFEIAKSEIGYTEQRPAEYSAAVLAAAVKEGFAGPVFIQGDHFQAKATSYVKDPAKEIAGLESLVLEALAAGFYNIDIDSSTLVVLERPTEEEQQRDNFEVAAAMTAFIRRHEPLGVTVSVGGEIGEVGGKNSTVEEFEVYMQGLNKALPKGMKGISKISVQTGTSHGGIPLPDGTVAKVKLDFKVLEDIGAVARSEYGLSGTVQHGASTLPDEMFHRFVEAAVAEVHLATGFQNMIYDHAAFPADLRARVCEHLKVESAKERKDGETDEQFLYKTRKKGFGPFKREMWSLPAEAMGPIMAELEGKFSFLFEQLRVAGSSEAVARHVASPIVVPERPRGL
ncbi:MAG: class II fructose-bisphosphate aldolase [Candidatus Eisenbacteria bacterium]|jgi:fructose/tagatose bisphosphate aldolase|nr:class II fructose-bisphosphate aldolase [Candidatus Eisenbacteria bacterium]